MTPPLLHAGRLRRSRRTLIAATALAAAALSCGVASAAPSDLDRTFGSRGLATIDFEDHSESVNAVALGPGGAIVGVGSTDLGFDALVFRLDAAGKLDPTFGSGGIRTLDEGATSLSANDVAVQPDGGLVVVGYTSTHNDVVVWRLRPDGAPDTGFGVGGRVTLDAGGADRGMRVVVQPDGRIVVGGQTSLGNDLLIYRLLPDGSLDPSFDGDGRLGIDSGGDERLGGLALQRDGRIVVSGDTTLTHSAVIYRLRPDGSFDPSFDGDGRLAIDVSDFEYGADVTVDPAGRILLTGMADYDVLVTRREPDGTPDRSFAKNGIALIDTGDTAEGQRLMLRPDGGILVAGYTSAGTDTLLAALRVDGSPDEAFADHGFETFGGRLETTISAALQPDGRVVLAATSDTEDPAAFVYRLDGFFVEPSSPGPPLPAAPSAPDTGAAPTTPGTTGRPTSAAPHGTASDVTAPRLAGLRVLRTAAGRLQARFTLSEPARVRFTVQPAGGRRVRRAAAAFTVSAPAGAGRLDLGARAAVRRLTPGRYRLVAVATDAAGNTAGAVSARLAIGRRR